MKCGACQRDCRTTKLANVAEPDGGMRRARVCGKCFDSAIHIVPRVTLVKKGVDPTAAARREAKDATKGAVKKIRNTAKAYRATQNDDGERAAGLDQAADLLEAGDY